MKCKNCKLYNEMPESACCAWYLDNVVFGDKTLEDCSIYIPCDKEKGGEQE